MIVVTSKTLDEKLAGLIRFARRLSLIQCIGAGVEKFPLESLRGTRTVLADGSGANAVSVTEHAFALMLALAKKICKKNAEVKRGEWSQIPLTEMLGKTLVILGVGAIGTELAKRSLAFGMRVIGTKKHPVKKNEVPGCEIFGTEALHELLPQADFLTVTLSLTSKTRSLIGEAELRLMKPTSSIIIVSRAAIVQKEALHRALSEHWISGAGIDTWYAAPPDPTAPSRYSIHGLPNVIATPHIAGNTVESVDRTFAIVGRNIDALATGKELVNVVDPSLEY